MRRKKLTQNISGLTIFELVMVIAIIGIMTGFAMPAIFSYAGKYRIKGAASELHHNLQLTKINAIKITSTWVSHKFAFGSHRQSLIHDVMLSD